MSIKKGDVIRLLFSFERIINMITFITIRAGIEFQKNIKLPQKTSCS